MTDYFFDSSGLTKRYIIEAGTGWVQSTTAPAAGHTIFIAQITPVEVTSAVSRQKYLVSHCTRYSVTFESPYIAGISGYLS